MTNPYGPSRDDASRAYSPEQPGDSRATPDGGQYAVGTEYGHGPRDAGPEGPPKRSTLMTVLGWVFAIITAFLALGALSSIAQGNFGAQGGGAGRVIGFVIGFVVIMGVPAVLSYLCFTSHKRSARRRQRR